MTLDELESLLKRFREERYIDGHTEVRVLQYRIEKVIIGYPLIGVDGNYERAPMSHPFAITIFPVIT